MDRLKNLSKVKIIENLRLFFFIFILKHFNFVSFQKSIFNSLSAEYSSQFYNIAFCLAVDILTDVLNNLERNK